MYFKDLLQSGSADYGDHLKSLSSLVVDALSQLVFAYRVSEAQMASDHSFHHASTLSLTRHICESLDGVAVLVEQGCPLPSQPLLRSALEAYFSVHFILEQRTVERGLSYQLAHAHRRIRLYRSFCAGDPTEKETRAMMASDPIASGIAIPQMDYAALIANLERMLKKAEYVPIEAEWQRLKRAKCKFSWYTLFDGPKNIREIAQRLQMTAMYDFLYRKWSNSVHAGDCLESYAKSKEGGVAIRPIRHPEGIEAVVRLACTYSLGMAWKLLEMYGTDEARTQFRQQYVSLRARLDSHLGRSIDAPWK